MQNAVEGACAEAGARDLVVSGDGSWQKRGFSSHNGVAAVISSSDVPKVLDIEQLSKRRTVCDDAKSIKQSDPSSTNSDPYHEWCSPAYCGFWKALEKGISNWKYLGTFQITDS
ncbi:unnamed protein product [Rotaria sordida]|uniref:Mutator-like transposase domain-containing protein n=2 Tax=Rotaria sordida TaxID=392033 RepID=A0A815MJW7_9BILA|nr:unnamed protein product [Rotaria sordida]